MFEVLARINARPQPFAHYTTPDLWNDPHVSRKMLELHLDANVDMASRNAAFVERSARWIISRFGLGPGKRVCDLGCGPGLYTTRFAAAGVDVTGVDLSENSIAYARKAAARDGLGIEYVLGNYLDFEPGAKFDLITMIFCDFCVLSPVQRKILLDKMRGMLAVGGRVFFDVFSPAFFESIEEKSNYQIDEDGGFWSANRNFVFFNTFRYDADRVILHKYTIIEKDRIRESYNWLQCYDRESLEALFAENGFRVADAFANVAGDPYADDGKEFAVIARKTI